MHKGEYVAIKKINLEKCADHKIDEIRVKLLSEIEILEKYAATQSLRPSQYSEL